MDDNVTLIGTLGSDPELRYTQAGKAMATGSLAITPRRKNSDGEWEDGETSWYNIVAFGSLAENFASSAAKGSRVMVNGRLSVRKWEGKDGTKGTSVEVMADDIGASMRWATMEIERNSRSDGSGGSRSRAPKTDDFDDDPFG